MATLARMATEIRGATVAPAGAALRAVRAPAAAPVATAPAVAMAVAAPTAATVGRVATAASGGGPPVGLRLLAPGGTAPAAAMAATAPRLVRRASPLGREAPVARAGPAGTSRGGGTAATGELPGTGETSMARPEAGQGGMEAAVGRDPLGGTAATADRVVMGVQGTDLVRAAPVATAGLPVRVTQMHPMRTPRVATAATAAPGG